ncbi:MAG: hypothetical protein ACKOBY_05875 [Cyanobium sp.]
MASEESARAASAAPASTPTPEDATSGGGWPLIEGWARATLSPTGLRLWQTLNHRSACLSCAWGTGGQNGGFRDELGEPLQRCLKSVEAIGAELQPAVPREVFAGRTLAELQRLTQLIAEATVLATGAPGAGKAGALVVQRLPKARPARGQRGPGPAVDQRPAASGDHVLGGGSLSGGSAGIGVRGG